MDAGRGWAGDKIGEETRQELECDIGALSQQEWKADPWKVHQQTGYKHKPRGLDLGGGFDPLQ